MVRVIEGAEVKKSVCVWCKGECGVLVYVKDGWLVKVEEDPDWTRKVWPHTKGCVRFRVAQLSISITLTGLTFPSEELVKREKASRSACIYHSS